ncbi:MAG: FtsW/RodA/SpoVE family cell cycle protein, partial [Acetatifactor sp.]|nr:FtsW/RodA/SpoVE family cell cycle protein [Acetatifactor sp.]
MGDCVADGKRRKKEQTEYFFDYSLLFIVLFLMGFGLVMIYSASSYEAQQDYGSGTCYLCKQLLADILGLVVMIVMANIPYRFWRRFTTLAYFASFGLIFLVLTPLGVESHGARRWVGIPGTGFNLQP